MHLKPATSADVEDILALQRVCALSEVTHEVARSEGFIVARHSAVELEQLSYPVPHAIARGDSGQLLGYILSMSTLHRDVLPLLTPMFEQFDNLSWKNSSLQHLNYAVVGQICIAPEARKTGLFKSLYAFWFSLQAPHFTAVFTEIEARNSRSLAAHQAIGFKEIGQFIQGEYHWLLVGRNV